MSWREPELVRAAGRNDGVRISARRTGKGTGMSVYVTVGRATMDRLGFNRGDELQPLVGADEDLGWVAIRKPPADGSARVLMKVGSVGGGSRAARTASRVQFSSAYLDGVAAVAPMTATNTPFRIEAGMLAVRLPAEWIEAYKSGEKIDTVPEPLREESRADADPVAVSEPTASRSALKGAAKNAAPWSEDDPELRRLHAEGLKPEEIGRRLGRTSAAVTTRLYTLGLKGPRAKKGGPDALTAPPPPRAPRVAVHVTSPAPARAKEPKPAAPPAPVEDVGLEGVLAAPIAFLRDAGMKIAPNPMAGGTWFVDGEVMTSRQLVTTANGLRAQAGLKTRYSLGDSTDRLMTAEVGGGSSLADAGM